MPEPPPGRSPGELSDSNTELAGVCVCMYVCVVCCVLCVRVSVCVCVCVFLCVCVVCASVTSNHGAHG
jgi:hypothetical protein